MTSDADESVIRVRIGAIEFLLTIPPDYRGTEADFVAETMRRLEELLQPLPASAGSAAYNRLRSHNLLAHAR